MALSREVARQGDARAQAVARREDNGKKLKAVLDSYAPLIRESLPKHLNGDRMARLLLNSCRKVPDLLTCSPESLVGSVLSLSALGLEVDVAGESWVVPYKGDASPIVGYQGWTKLYYQHPMAAELSAEVVWAADEFDYEKGTSPSIHHKPARVKREDRGGPVAFYAVATLTNGRRLFEVLTPDDVIALRGKLGPNGKIADPMFWMARKTALRQVLKVAPRSIMVARALEVDERPGAELLPVVSQIDDDRAAIEQRGQADPAPTDVPPEDEPPVDDGERYPSAEESAAKGDPWAQAQPS